MKNRHREQWEALGATDPYWAVLSYPEKKGGTWDTGEFFDTGRREIAEVLRRLDQLGSQPTRGVALDFGCGVGRLSRALSRHFSHVIGIDVSESMLAEARSANSAYTNITFLHNDADNLDQIASESVDFVYSNIVLQHMPTKRQRLFVEELCRVLSPGGVLVFQTPSRANLMRVKGWIHFLVGNRLLNLVRRFVYGRNGVMELHPLANESVLEILRTHGMCMLHSEQNDAAGAAFVSYAYYAVKN